MIEDIIINGLIHGGVYALLAIGFSLIFGVARIMNMAHTAFYMLAAYLIFTFTTYVGLGLPLSIIFSIIAVIILGIFSYKLVIDRVRQHEIATVIVTLALAIIIQEVMLRAFGGSYHGVPRLISGYVQVLGVKITYQYLLTLGIVLIILLGIWALLLKTKLGIAMRCTAQDRVVANLMGINVARTGMITMAIAVGLAAIAGAVVAPLFTLEPYMWQYPLVMVLAIVVLGGLGSIKGSLVGAFILGFTETAVVFLVPSGAFLKGSVALMVMVVVILIRPEGLFGVVFEEEK